MVLFPRQEIFGPQSCKGGHIRPIERFKMARRQQCRRHISTRTARFGDGMGKGGIFKCFPSLFKFVRVFETAEMEQTNESSWWVILGRRFVTEAPCVSKPKTFSRSRSDAHALELRPLTNRDTNYTRSVPILILHRP